MERLFSVEKGENRFHFLDLILYMGT